MALSSISANAEIITFGSLSTDADYDVIADTEIGREYLRFDEFDLTYAETIAATSSGGIYDGWSIADSDISDNFINALFSQSGENVCSTGDEVFGKQCGTLSGWLDGAFGASDKAVTDRWAYISTHDTINRSGDQVGVGYIYSEGYVYDRDDWDSFDTVDYFSHSRSGNPTNFLLYRENTLHIGGFNVDAAANDLVSTDIASVPLPATLGLLGLAMAGLSFRRKPA